MREGSDGEGGICTPGGYLLCGGICSAGARVAPFLVGLNGGQHWEKAICDISMIDIIWYRRKPSVPPLCSPSLPLSTLPLSPASLLSVFHFFSNSDLQEFKN